MDNNIVSNVMAIASLVVALIGIISILIAMQQLRRDVYKDTITKLKKRINKIIDAQKTSIINDVKARLLDKDTMIDLVIENIEVSYPQSISDVFRGDRGRYRLIRKTIPLNYGTNVIAVDSTEIPTV